MQAGCLGMLWWWMENGGGQTLLSYGQEYGHVPDPSVVPGPHLAWMAGLPVTHNDGKRLFVHAGVQSGVALTDQDEQRNTWMLYPDGAEDGYTTADGAELHVVHGHHQHEEGPLLFVGRTNLDTLAWWTGRLVIGVFDDDKPGGPVATIEVKGPTIRELMGKREAA